MRKIFVAALAVCVLFLGAFLPAQTVEAAAPLYPTVSDNLDVGAKSYSSLTATSDGYMRVFYDGSAVKIEYYDNSFNIKSKKSVAMELSRWGGFYAGSDAYYLIEGQNNTAENDSAEVIRVIRYDTDWNRLGATSIMGDSQFAHEIRYPFDSFSCEMDECNGTLYIVTAHEGYVDPYYNQGHTGFLMIAVDIASMTGKIVDADLWHSFAQYIEHKNSTLYILEQSEGSRYAKISKGDAADPKRSATIPILKYGGVPDSAWSIPCYATVDGLALSSGNVLSLGTSIDQSKYDQASSSALPYNIYLTVTPMSDFTEDATAVKWLTNYTSGSKRFYGTKITKVNDDRFMISWEEAYSEGPASEDDNLSGSVLHYVFVDGDGNKIGSEYTAGASISDCQPIVKGSKIVYCASGFNMVNFYTIDSTSGQFSKKVYRIAGENAAWDMKNGVLTISGNGGIIPERAFAYNGNITEVVIEDGITSIGKEAFYGCGALTKITIPSGVTSIGDDILWTGSTWIGSGGHVVKATVYTYSGSKAAQYAKDNNIKYVLLDESGSDTAASSSSSSSSSSDPKPQSSSSSTSSNSSTSSSSSKSSSTTTSSKSSSTTTSSKSSSTTTSSKSSSSTASSPISASTSMTSSDSSTPQIIPDTTSSVTNESSSGDTSISESVSDNSSSGSTSSSESTSHESSSSSSTTQGPASSSESSSIQTLESGDTPDTGSGTNYGESEPDSSDNSKPWVIPTAAGGGAVIVGTVIAVTVGAVKKRKKM